MSSCDFELVNITKTCVAFGLAALEAKAAETTSSPAPMLLKRDSE